MEKNRIVHNPKQKAFIKELCKQYYKTIALYGGGRSGKTFIICEQILRSCYLFPGIKVLILRESLSSGKNTILDTLFYILNNYYPYNSIKYLDYGKNNGKKDRFGNKGSANTKEGIISFRNGSRIQIGGVQNIDKYLGGQYQIIYLNEATQLPESVFFGIHSIVSRLSGFVPIPEQFYHRFEFECSNVKEPVYSSQEYLDKKILFVPFYLKNNNFDDGKKYAPLQLYVDFNPSYKTHWTYNLFIKKMDNKGNYYHDAHRMLVYKINPVDNLHLPQEQYIANFTDDDSRKRFVEGEFLDEDGTMFKFNSLKRYTSYPEFTEIFFTCDLASTDNRYSDYSVVCCWGLVENSNDSREFHIYLLDMHRSKTDIDQWIEFIGNFINNWTFEKVESYGIVNHSEENKVFLLEDTSNPTLLKNTIGKTNEEVDFRIIMRKKIRGGGNKLNRLREVAPLINFNSVVHIPDDNFIIPFEPDENYLNRIMAKNEDFSFKDKSKKQIYLDKMITFIEDEFNSCKVKNSNLKSTKSIKDDIIDNFADAVAYKYCLEYNEAEETYFRVEPLIYQKNAQTS